MVAVNALGGLAGLATFFFHPGVLELLAVALVLLQAAALWWRRSHPSFVLAVVAMLALAQWLISGSNGPANLSVVFAVYAVSVYARGNVRLWVAGVAIGLIALAVGSLIFNKLGIARAVLPVGAPSLIAWVIGDYIRSRRQFLADMEERHRQERASAAEEERLRIARELHDVVAHNVSLIAIQAGAARVSGDSTDETLRTIEHGARDTLAELNKLLGVLRKVPTAPELTPQPKLDDVDGLLKAARDAGLHATLKVTGEKHTLPAAVDLSAYRIVQEAITNVLKHASATRVEVSVDYTPDAIAVAVSDNGSGATSTESTGHGLIGMRERAELFGGDLTTGSSSLGGFTVRATLPVKT